MASESLEAIKLPTVREIRAELYRSIRRTEYLRNMLRFAEESQQARAVADPVDRRQEGQR